MKQTLLSLLLLAALSSNAQTKDYKKEAQSAQQKTTQVIDSTQLIYKGNQAVYNSLVLHLEKLKLIMLQLNSPHQEMVRIEELINSIYQQIVPQIKK